MAYASINRLIRHFHTSLESLGAAPGMAQVEHLAMVVHRCMGAKTRAYHTTEHVFALCDGANPIQTLAALFHDTVYVQLDGGLPGPLQSVLGDAIDIRADAVYLRGHPGPNRTSEPTDPLEMAMAVFGFRHGQALPAFGGMNEFLSAVAALRMLSPWVPGVVLLEIAACIEATIPFRPDASDGSSALDRLHTRVLKHLEHARFGLDSGAAARAATSAVTNAMALANRDVGGFAESDPSVFLGQTWLLIEESNKPLASLGLYTIQEYRGALQRMDAFLAQLNPASVFQHFAGCPDADTLAVLTERAAANIRFSVRYLRAKLLAMAVLEAFSQLTGGDAPISMFLGEPARKDPRDKAGGLPAVRSRRDCDPVLLRILSHGRARSSAADLSASPTAAFIYRSIGEKGLQQQWELASRYFAGHLAPQEYLRECPATVVASLLDLSAASAISRQESLRALRRELQHR